VQEKEALILERDGLELKKLRSGETISKEMERVSLQVKSLEGSLLQEGEGSEVKGRVLEQLSSEK
jgi:hypothetical protein